jgi:hypothetical protein
VGFFNVQDETKGPHRNDRSHDLHADEEQLFAQMLRQLSQTAKAGSRAGEAA